MSSRKPERDGMSSEVVVIIVVVLLVIVVVAVVIGGGPLFTHTHKVPATPTL